MPPQRPKLIETLARLPKIGQPVKALHDVWLRRRLWQHWRNQGTPARRLFQEQAPRLNSVQSRVLRDLEENGIAFAGFDELIADQPAWDKIVEHVQLWLESAEVKQKERDYLSGGFRNARWKEYVLMMHGTESPVVAADSPLLEFGLRAELLDVVNSYFGLCSRLFHVDAWKTIPARHENAPTGSQRWHRDPEDLKLVKVFLYLSDVDATAGPLHYVRKSRRGDKYGELWPQQLPYGNVAPEGQLESLVPDHDRVVCQQPAGTFVFADTTGLHMGGRATNNERLFALWAYSSTSSAFPRSFKIDEPLRQPLSAVARFALVE